MRLDARIFVYGGVKAPPLLSMFDEISVWARTPGLCWLATPVAPSDLPKSRSRILSGALQANPRSDVLVMLDRDHVWEPGSVLALAQRAVAEEMLLGLVYALRREEGGWAFDPAVTGEMTLSEDSYLEAIGVGAGVLAIPLKRAAELSPIMSSHGDPWFRILEYKDPKTGFLWRDFFRPGPMPWNGKVEYKGEDFAFTLRWVAAGGDAAVWTLPRCGHITDKILWPEDGAPRLNP
jgi:hypothetical protein